jgi:hypothetical protein
MSLAIHVGVLACGDGADPDAVNLDRQNFRHINRLLAERELPLHEEPESLPKLTYRGQLISFPYLWTPYLLRAVAHALHAPREFGPVRAGEDPSQDKQIDAALYTFAESHIICHSQTEGYFVPIDFEDVIADNRKGGLTGRLLGSSQRALKELVRTAPLLEIPLVDKQLSDDAARSLAKEPDESHPCWIERKVWLSMFEAFRHSVEHKCAVVYA